MRERLPPPGAPARGLAGRDPVPPFGDVAAEERQVHRRRLSLQAQRWRKPCGKAMARTASASSSQSKRLLRPALMWRMSCMYCASALLTNLSETGMRVTFGLRSVVCVLS